MRIRGRLAGPDPSTRRSDGEPLHERASKREDPRGDNSDVIGAFCGTYAHENATRAIIPGTYGQSGGRERGNRDTLSGATGFD